jgi:hypothetical protein
MTARLIDRVSVVLHRPRSATALTPATPQVVPVAAGPAPASRLTLVLRRVVAFVLRRSAQASDIGW